MFSKVFDNFFILVNLMLIEVFGFLLKIILISTLVFKKVFEFSKALSFEKKIVSVFFIFENLTMS